MAKKKARKKAPSRKKIIPGNVGPKIKLQQSLVEKAAPKVFTQYKDDGAFLMVKALRPVTKASQHLFMRSLPEGLSGEVLQGERGLFRFRVDSGRANFKRFTNNRGRGYPSVDALLDLANELNKRFLKRGFRTTVVIELMQGGAYTPVEIDMLDPIVG